MAKWGLIAATVISVVILACPAGYAAMAESNANPSVRQSVDTTMQNPCTKARADKQCAGEANQCFYKFTVKEVVDQQNLKVTYPPSVWKETEWEKLPESERDQTPEEKYKKEVIGENPFSIRLKPTDRSVEVKAGTTYVFTRCPENEFTLGPEIDPNQTGKPRGPEQSKR